ncbi:hypothetical protein [Ensifer sp. 4252]|uniref:hypothetical protein n=1 Tax=Ensifer sp. 4252 TaxID=3373915 RepID=UPI003D24CEE6
MKYHLGNFGSPALFVQARRVRLNIIHALVGGAMLLYDIDAGAWRNNLPALRHKNGEFTGKLKPKSAQFERIRSIYLHSISGAA